MFRTIPTATALAAALLGSMAHAADPALDTTRIESITGLTGTFNQAENVFKISKPRTDVKPNVDRWTLPPFMGITSYAAFTPMVGGAMVMGDTVLLEDEVNPAMSAALDAGLEVTALHNHFFSDEPRIFFMHVHGHGAPMDLARKVKPALDLIGRQTKPSSPPAVPA